MKNKYLYLIIGLLFTYQATAQVSDISIIAYNIAMLSPSQDYQEKRIVLVPNVVKDYDVVIISEAFEYGVRNTLTTALAGYGFQHSCVLGSKDDCEYGGAKLLCKNGGVIIYSKYPIIEQDQRRYYPISCEPPLAGDACQSWDCYARKGALYVRINKKGVNYSLFGSHTQASYDNSEKYKKARKIHFNVLNDFINAKNIPKNEPIIIAGDLNVDLLTDVAEYNDMLATLNAYHPNRKGANYTTLPQECACLKVEKAEYLDYILFRNDHPKPYEATIETKLVSENYKVPTGIGGLGKGKICCDVSDHFPITCFAKFDIPSDAKNNKGN